MFRFLRNYRATPHCNTGYPPATLLCGRTMKTKLPEIREKQSPDWGGGDKDIIAKKKMKQYADSKRYVKQDNFNIGDSVLLKKDPSFKKGVPYHETPFTVTAKKGTIGFGTARTVIIMAFMDETKHLLTKYAGMNNLCQRWILFSCLPFVRTDRDVEHKTVDYSALPSLGIYPRDI
ncbi:hypothetical protein LSH36_486g03017 [Paralvinella palmiformis]|uniref:Uncharacterized protein n=1 Tax=Paralvinella palmiformis TaxID=53620 RepID=A0AAD9MZH3_9ANNE|nr:hypothetical protein LSH36_486g03017 [Paralvinella palmiformis]